MPHGDESLILARPAETGGDLLVARRSQFLQRQDVAISGDVDVEDWSFVEPA